MEPRLEPIMAEADCLLIDGTAWSDDEMARYGVGTRRARDMGHLYLDGPGGTLEWLRRFPRPRKILIHINNTNPVLNENSPERASVAAAGIELAYDGMDIEL
jgi:pyrroloquinoline quinone biosynthesis protein B